MADERFKEAYLRNLVTGCWSLVTGKRSRSLSAGANAASHSSPLDKVNKVPRWTSIKSRNQNNREQK